jgi:hydroxyacylglutathione hydrolase
LVIDPGDEPGKITAALSEAEMSCAAILITHGHYDHVGAVAPVARGHGCPVYISSGESHMLENLEK